MVAWVLVLAILLHLGIADVMLGTELVKGIERRTLLQASIHRPVVLAFGTIVATDTATIVAATVVEATMAIATPTTIPTDAVLTRKQSLGSGDGG